MICFRRSSLTALGAGYLLALSLGAAAPSKPSQLTGAWQALSVGFYSEAGEQFERAATDREARLGTAITLINRPPVTSSSLAEAQRRFTELSRVSDATGRAARYFLARLQQLHPIAPDPAAAAQHYEALVATGVDDLWCRLALIKLVMLHLTVLPGDLATRFATAEASLARTHDSVTQRDLHLVIAEARLSHRVYDATTLAHLQAAIAATGSAEVLRVDMLIQAGRLATMLGDHATARASYAAFLKDYPKDRRAYTVEAALANLDRPFPP